MGRRNGWATTLALAAALATGCATTPAVPDGEAMQASASAARALLEAGEWSAADRRWTDLLADARFAALPREVRASMLSDAGDAATAVDDHDRARDLLLRSVRIAPGDVDAWWRLALVELRRDEADAAATALARIALTEPGVVDNIDTELIGFVLGEADPDGLPRLDLLQALFDAGWTREGLGTDHLWVDLGVLLVERGEPDRAARVVDRIDDPSAIVRLRMDKRFDALVDRGAARFDVGAAMQRKLSRLQALSAAHPHWLEARNFVGFALLETGDAAAALEDTDDILAEVAAADPATPPFGDMDELSWVGNTRAIALRRLGRLDEAVAAMREASQLGEAGGENVSQVLNLGSLLCGLGRWDEARATIAGVGEMSGYGKMVEADIDHCIATGLGDGAAAAAAIDYLRAHREDAEAIYLDALLRAGQLDEAAAIVIRQLQSPRARGAVLLAMQGFREAPPLPARIDQAAAWDALLARADVQAAITEVGRVEQHPIHSDTGF